MRPLVLLTLLEHVFCSSEVLIYCLYTVKAQKCGVCGGDVAKVPKLQLAPKHGDTSAPSSARSGAGTPRNANPPGPKTAGVGLRLTDNHPHRAVQVVQNGPGRYTVSDLHAAPYV